MRFERKYRIESHDWRQVLEVVRAHPLSFRTAFPDRQVNNIYLDTPDLSDFNENLMGISQRAKYRVRWYGDDLLHLRKPVLEIKSKEAGMGDKFFAKLPDFDWQGGRELRPILDGLFKTLRAEGFAAASMDNPENAPAIIPLRGLRPTLINTYKRSYFISMDGKFRLTIDRDLHFYNPDLRLHPGRNFAEDHAVVVEVKYEADKDDDYDRVGKYFPFQISRNSKYVTGILLVNQ